MKLPLMPVWFVDMAGSALMIIFSLLCLRTAKRLRNLDRQNVVWTYLLWLSYSLAGFAFSRSAGHILKRLLLAADRPDLWEVIKPFSGSANSIAFMVVAAITIFFGRMWKIYEQVSRDKKALQEAQEKLLFTNRNLETLVAERTRELASSEHKYRRIFETSQDMIVMVSPEGTVMDINPSGMQMMGLVPPTAVPEAVHRFENFFCCRNEYRSLQEILISQGFFSDAEIQLKHLNGSPISVLISGAVERQDCRETSMAHFLVKDISQRKAMEKQLMQADKLASIGQLASGIAHEINNPLNIILGYTQLLLRDEEKDSQKHQDLRIIEKHARTCKIIVGDLLSFARSTKTKKGVTHIHRVIEELLSVVRNSFELDRIHIERVFDSQVPEMVLDEEKIKQVFMNLLMNAKQAIGKDGTIQVISQYKSSCSQVRVQVIDSGCGIAPEHLSCIFDPFFTTKSTGEGTGLGLSVSYGIIKDHGGDIKVESHVGIGTTFTVMLPEVLPETPSTEPNGARVSQK